MPSWRDRVTGWKYDAAGFSAAALLGTCEEFKKRYEEGRALPKTALRKVFRKRVTGTSWPMQVFDRGCRLYERGIGPCFPSCFVAFSYPL
jgi:hypothetical protein